MFLFTAGVAPSNPPAHVPDQKNSPLALWSHVSRREIKPVSAGILLSACCDHARLSLTLHVGCCWAFWSLHIHPSHVWRTHLFAARARKPCVAPFVCTNHNDIHLHDSSPLADGRCSIIAPPKDLHPPCLRASREPDRSETRSQADRAKIRSRPRDCPSYLSVADPPSHRKKVRAVVVLSLLFFSWEKPSLLPGHRTSQLRSISFSLCPARTSLVLEKSLLFLI